MRTLIRNGRIVDPSQGVDAIGDLSIEGEFISGVRLHGVDRGKNSMSRSSDTRIIEAEGHLVLPGLVDMHVHLREPGFEHKETIRTGTLAAVRGGFTAVCPMPNTRPVNDNPSVTGYMLRKVSEEGHCSVHPIGAITKGQQGEELAEIGMMHRAGCVGFSDDGRPVMNSLTMRRALEYTKTFGVPVISHCEDLNLSEGGGMNECRLATALGLKGIPAEAEDIMVARDLLLARLTGGRLHIAHVSSAGAVRLIREAKALGISVTAETCPHYFCLTEDAVDGYNTNAKVNPPLRTSADVEAIREGLKDGTLDVVATDHAPHHQDEKLLEFDRAPSGISGLETALSLTLRLVSEGVLSVGQLIEKMSLAPSRILGLGGGTLRSGAPADVIVVDPVMEWTVNPEEFASLGRNTPFAGWRLKGRSVVTIFRGTVNTLLTVDPERGNRLG